MLSISMRRASALNETCTRRLQSTGATRRLRRGADPSTSIGTPWASCYAATMTSSRTKRTPQTAAPINLLAREFGETIRLAAPMALTQLSQIAMMTTDLAFIGRLGGDAIAAAALAGTIYFVSFTFGMGLMSAV